MPKMYKPSQIRAKDLMVDDWFKMGGQLYRIVRIKTNAFNELVISFYSTAQTGKRRIMLMIVTKKTFFKAFNQA